MQPLPFYAVLNIGLYGLYIEIIQSSIWLNHIIERFAQPFEQKML